MVDSETRCVSVQDSISIEDSSPRKATYDSAEVKGESRFGWINSFKNLQRCYGTRLLVMISLTTHWCKGFGRFQLLNSQQYLFQSPWSVTGPQMDIYFSICELPWVMKPLLSICSDMFPIFGYRKLPYIIFTSLLGLGGVVLASFINPSVSTVEVPLTGLFLMNFAWMTGDVLVEGVYARRMSEQASSGPDLIVFIAAGQQVCCLLASFVSGFVISETDGLLGFSGAQWNLAVCFFPTAGVLIGALSNFINEQPMTETKSIETRNAIWTNQRSIVWLSIFIGLGSMTFTMCGMFFSANAILNLCVSLGVLIILNILFSLTFEKTISHLMIFLGLCSMTNLGVGGPAHYFYTDDESQYPAGPHFEPWFYVTVCGVVGAIAGVIAACLFAKYKNAKYKKVYIITILANMLISLPNSILFSRANVKWGVSDYVFMGSGTALSTALVTLYYMPGALLLSRVCPEKIESTMFAILTSNINLAQATGGALSGVLSAAFGLRPNGSLNESAQFESMWIANLVMAGVKTLPIFFIFLIPNLKMTDTLHSV